MSDTSSRWRFFKIGMALLAVPVVIIAWWIYVTQTNRGDFPEKVAQFNSVFPDFLAEGPRMTWIQLLFCGGACLAFFKGLDQRGFPMVASLIMLGFSGLIGFWLLMSFN